MNAVVKSGPWAVLDVVKEAHWSSHVANDGYPDVPDMSCPLCKADELCVRVALHQRLLADWKMALRGWNLKYDVFPSNNDIQANIIRRGGYILLESEEKELQAVKKYRSDGYWGL